MSGLVVALVLVGLYASLEQRSPYEGVVDELFLGVFEDTEFADGYADASFADVTVGMTVADVTDLVGSPIQIWDCGDAGCEVWKYAWSPSSTDYRLRDVIVEDGVVIAVETGPYWD